MSAAWKKKKVNILGPEWTDEDRKAYHWCINNGVKISPFAASNEYDN